MILLLLLLLLVPPELHVVWGFINKRILACNEDSWGKDKTV